MPSRLTGYRAPKKVLKSQHGKKSRHLTLHGIQIAKWMDKLYPAMQYIDYFLPSIEAEKLSGKARQGDC